MAPSLLFNPGFWIAVILIIFTAAIYAALLLSFLSAWTDDRKWQLSGWLRKIYSIIPGGQMAIDDFDDHDVSFGLIIAPLILAIIALLGGFMIAALWPFIIAAAGAYFLIRGIRFARRTKKAVGKVINVAHGHKGGKVKPAKIDSPEF